MEPDQKKFIEDFHQHYYKMMAMAEAQGLIEGADKVLISEGVMDLMHAMANFEQAMPESKQWGRNANVVNLAIPSSTHNPASR